MGESLSEQARILHSLRREDGSLTPRMDVHNMICTREIAVFAFLGAMLYFQALIVAFKLVESNVTEYHPELFKLDKRLIPFGHTDDNSRVVSAFAAPRSGLRVDQRSALDGRAFQPGEIAERLRDVAFQKGSMDNIAVVVVDLRALSDAAKEKAGSNNASGERSTDPKGTAAGATGKHDDDVSQLGGKQGGDGSKPKADVSSRPGSKAMRRSSEEAVTGETAERAIVQVDDSSLVEAGDFKVYISGQVVYGEGSDWCYQLVELVSSLRALPAPDTRVVAVPSDANSQPIHTEQRPSCTEALAASPSAPVYTEGVHAEHVYTEPVPTEPLPVCSASEAPVHTGEGPVHTPGDLHPIPLGLDPPDGGNALPQSPSPWATTLELYHRHLVATVDPNGFGATSRSTASDGSAASEGLGTFLDIVASVPVEPGGWTDVRPGVKRPPGEGTGEEVGEEWTPAGVQREEGDHR